MNKLKEICDMVLKIEEGLMNGTVPFCYDNLMSAMKPGHPMEILDEILSAIYFTIEAGEIPPQDRLESTLKQFKAFKSAFQVKEMKEPISALEKYLKTKINLTFPIYIAPSGESSVEYPVSEVEFAKLKKAVEDDSDFDDTPGLKKLYEKVMRAARKQLIEDLDLTDDDMDVDNLDYTIGFPDFPIGD